MFMFRKRKYKTCLEVWPKKTFIITNVIRKYKKTLIRGDQNLFFSVNRLKPKNNFPSAASNRHILSDFFVSNNAGG